MRQGSENGHLFCYVAPESLIPADHPLRGIRILVNQALERMEPSFASIYAKDGRPSVPPERLLRALLLQALFSVRSERQLMEQLTYNLLYRWFVGLAMDGPVWDVRVFTKNRDRLLAGDVARGFFRAVFGGATDQAAAVERPFLGRWNADQRPGRGG